MTQEEKEKLIEAIEWEKGSYLNDEMYDYGAIAMGNKIIEIVKEMKVDISEIEYEYGMRLRGYGVGCQPKKGLVGFSYSDKQNKYYNYLYYDRKLSDAEMKQYELDFLGEVKNER